MAGLLSRLGRKKSVHIWSAVVVAAGSARRMEGIDKVLTTLGELPVLVHTLRVFQQCPDIAEIIVVTREDLMVEVGSICQDFALTKVSKVIKGGKERIHSVQAGLSEVREDAELIAIHDGARPLLPPDVLEEVLHRAAQTGAAAPAVPITDTVTRSENGLADGGPLHPVCRPDPPGVPGRPDPGGGAEGPGGRGGAHRRLRRRGAAGHEGVPHPGKPGEFEADHPL